MIPHTPLSRWGLNKKLDRNPGADKALNPNCWLWCQGQCYKWGTRVQKKGLREERVVKKPSCQRAGGLKRQRREGDRPGVDSAGEGGETRWLSGGSLLGCTEVTWSRRPLVHRDPGPTGD